MTNLIYRGFGIDRINAQNYKTSVNVTTFLKKNIYYQEKAGNYGGQALEAMKY